MFGRKNARSAVSDAAETVAPYAEQLVQDEKTRERVLAAVTAAIAARRRAQRQTGLTGLALRLGTDPILRAQLVEVATQLAKAQKRVQRHRSHKLRNGTLFLVGVGAVAAAFPGVRERVQGLFGGGPEPASEWQPAAPAAGPAYPAGAAVEPAAS